MITLHEPTVFVPTRTHVWPSGRSAGLFWYQMTSDVITCLLVLNNTVYNTDLLLIALLYRLAGLTHSLLN